MKRSQKERSTGSAASASDVPEDHKNLMDQWRARGMVDYLGEWRKLTATQHDRIMDRIQQMEDGLLTETKDGDCNRIATQSNPLPNKAPSSTAKCLHLESQHNGLANKIRKHLYTKYGSVVVQVFLIFTPKHSFNF